MRDLLDRIDELIQLRECGYLDFAQMVEVQALIRGLSRQDQRRLIIRSRLREKERRWAYESVERCRDASGANSPAHTYLDSGAS